jgi:Leucine-rich repeat (LRR) protein
VLAQVDVSHNRLSYLGEDMRHLKLLHHFNASHNNIEIVSEALHDCACLQHLDLAFNSLSTTPLLPASAEVVLLDHNNIASADAVVTAEDAHLLHLSMNCNAAVMPATSVDTTSQESEQEHEVVCSPRHVTDAITFVEAHSSSAVPLYMRALSRHACGQHEEALGDLDVAIGLAWNHAPSLTLR